MSNLRQADKPCPKCGSNYRRGDHCSNPDCKTYAPVPESFYIVKSKPFYEGKAPKGLGWDKSQHKVIR